MNKNRIPIKNFVALAWNMLLVVAMYAICRLFFIVVNQTEFPDMGLAHVVRLFLVGMKFDASAIFEINAPFILLFLLPLHTKETPMYYKALRWLYVVPNALCVIANVADTLYFPFTGRRTTMTVFREFANEDNITSIVLQQMGQHWLLCLGAVLMILALWVLYVSPQKKKVKIGSKRSYYTWATVVLLFAVLISIFMIRGRITRKRIGLRTADEFVRVPSEVGIITNTPFSMLSTFRSKGLPSPKYMSHEEAESLFSPMRNIGLPDSTATAEKRKMNVVVLIMEGLSKQHFGYYNIQKNENGSMGDKRSYTPFLDSLLINEKPLTFHYSYANGRKSIEATSSILASIPNFVEPFVNFHSVDDPLNGIARVLTTSWGYDNAFFHGANTGSLGLYFFSKTIGFNKYFGREDYEADSRYDGESAFDGTWGIFDEEFLQYYADRLSEMHEPFVASMFTLTNHHPFTLPERYKGVFPKGEVPFQECAAYSDYALRQFFEKAKQQPWYNNTLFVITADHTNGNFDPFYKSVIGHFCVPIIFYAPSLPWLSGYDDQTVVQQIDIMPTVLGILGYDQPYFAFGQDILHTPQEDKYAMHWITGNSTYEFVKGDYVVRFDGEKIQGIYSKTDYLAENNLAGSIDPEVRTSLEREVKAIVQQYMDCVKENKLTTETYK